MPNLKTQVRRPAPPNSCWERPLPLCGLPSTDCGISTCASAKPKLAQPYRRSVGETKLAKSTDQALIRG